VSFKMEAAPVRQEEEKKKNLKGREPGGGRKNKGGNNGIPSPLLHPLPPPNQGRGGSRKKRTEGREGDVTNYNLG